jgi:hypothetical protein
MKGIAAIPRNTVRMDGSANHIWTFPLSNFVSVSRTALHREPSWPSNRRAASPN